MFVNMADISSTKTLPVTPRNYKEVKALSLRDLKYLCKDANVKPEGIGRDALEILLCDNMGISTTGSRKEVRETKLPRLEDHCLDNEEIKEFEKMTPTYIQSLNGWTKNIKEIPDLDIGTVKKYLLSSNNPEFSKDILRKYKLSRSYGHLQAKNLHSVLYHSLPDSKTFCVVKAQCLPSQSSDGKRVKWLHVILDKTTAEPYGAFCVCTVGRGQACSHVGALLFLLCELVANGEEVLPDDTSCTDVKCGWTDPKSAAVVPKLMDEVSVADETKSKPTVKDYAQQVAPQLTPEENYQRVLKLIFDVRNSNKKSAMPAIVNIVDMNRFRPQPLPEPPVQSSLLDKCLDFDIPVSGEIHVNTYPMPVYKFPHKHFNSVNDPGFQQEREKFLSLIKLSAEDISQVEKITKGQSDSAEWFEQRKGAITGSKVIRIVNFVQHGRSNPENIVCDILQYKFDSELSSKVPALAWGLKNESKALNNYVKDLESAGHTEVEIVRPGLLVNADLPYIRVSPDAIVSCSCHGSKLVEVKCPYKFRNNDLNGIIIEGKLDYIEVIDGIMSVKKKQQRGYYEQILLQQVLSGVHVAEMLVWSKHGHVVVPVKLDLTYRQRKLEIR